MGVFCRGDWTDVGGLGGEGAGDSEGREDWTGELVSVWDCMSVCKRVFNVGFGPGLDSMSPASSWRSANHAAGSHDWLPQKTGGSGLWRGRIRWI